MITQGYLGRERLSDTIHVADVHRFVKRGRFAGEFFLWHTSIATGHESSPDWELVPADEARLSPDDLADVLLSGTAEIVEWRYETDKEKILGWKRSVRKIERATPRTLPDPTAKPPKPPVTPTGGPDLLILNDGRWFRGKIVRRDAQAVIIRTFVGQSEMDMTFKPDEVKEIQAPEKR